MDFWVPQTYKFEQNPICQDCKYIQQKIDVMNTRLEQRLKIYPQLKPECRQKETQTGYDDYDALLLEVQVLNSELNELKIQNNAKFLEDQKQEQINNEISHSLQNCDHIQQEYQHLESQLYDLLNDNQVLKSRFSATFEPFLDYKKLVYEYKQVTEENIKLRLKQQIEPRIYHLELQKARSEDLKVHIFESQLPPVLQSFVKYSFYFRVEFLTKNQPEVGFFFKNRKGDLMFQDVQMELMSQENTFKVNFQFSRVVQGLVPCFCVSIDEQFRFQPLSKFPVQFLAFDKNEFFCEALNTESERFQFAQLAFLPKEKILTLNSKTLLKLADSSCDCYLPTPKSGVQIMDCFNFDFNTIKYYLKTQLDQEPKRELLLVVRIGGFFTILRFEDQEHRDFCYLLIKKAQCLLFESVNTDDVSLETDINNSSSNVQNNNALGESVQLDPNQYIVLHGIASRPLFWTISHLNSQMSKIIVSNSFISAEQFDLVKSAPQIQETYEVRLIFKTGRSESSYGTAQQLSYLKGFTIKIFENLLIVSPQISINGVLSENTFIVEGLGSGFDGFIQELGLAQNQLL